MNRQLEKAFLALCILAGSAISAAEDSCKICGLTFRGDRCEGVITCRIDSGASFELLGVQFQQDAEAATGSDLVHLAFWLPEPAVLDEIRVWHPRAGDHDYWMEPRTKKYGEGRQGFSWPHGEVIDPIGLSTGSLYSLIKVGTVYFPALLSTREGPTPTGSYAFFFGSGGGLDAVCTIARQDEAAQVVRSFDCSEDYGGTILIEWDGRDDRGQPAPEGVYVLKVKGEMLAETLRPLNHKVSFWHPDPSRFGSTVGAGKP